MKNVGAIEEMWADLTREGTREGLEAHGPATALAPQTQTDPAAGRGVL